MRMPLIPDILIKFGGRIVSSGLQVLSKDFANPLPFLYNNSEKMFFLHNCLTPPLFFAHVGLISDASLPSAYELSSGSGDPASLWHTPHTYSSLL